MPARPAITMKIESTAAKIGRSMKKREIIAASLLLGLRRRFLGRGLAVGLAVLAGGTLAGSALAGGALGCSRGVPDLNRSAGRPHQLELHDPVDDDALAG